MRIAVLGPLEVRRDTGEPVPIPGAKERLLLAVLAAESPGVVSTDRIVEHLWNGERPPSARGSLQVHLVHLRSALEPERPRGSTGRFILRRGTGYSLAADHEDLDALRFTDLTTRGRALLASGDAEGAARTLTAALDLWRGEPYADWPDATFARAERRRLAEVRTGAVTALLEARLALGEAGEVVPELERRLAEDPLQEEWWRLLVLALYRGGRQGDALTAAQRARRVLVEELGTDPGPRLRAVEAAVLAQDPVLMLPAPGAPSPPPSTDGVPPDVATCPYKGLATYEATDASFFRGRGRLVTHLVARLVDAPLLVVSGSSGAGKSSVVRAGLVPALARDALPGSATWRAVVLTPGRRPVDTLAELTGDEPPDGPVLLVCDQFEELWAPGADPAERTAFLDTVLGLLADGIVVRCVVVVRGDHVGRLAEHTALTERVGSGVVLVPSLADDELREVVVEPAAAVGLDVEPDLVDTVIDDVRGRPGALPLLSTALVGTWERRRGTALTLAGYLEAGGVAGALTRSAEAAYAALDDQAQEVARRLLVRLADSDEAGALVRRPAPLTDLDLDGEGGDVRRTVIESFVTRRLLTVDGERLDVAHEALLTSWPRLARWLEDDAIGRAVRRHLTPAAQDWQRRGEPEDELYRGPRLAAALDWAAHPDVDVTPVEQRFLDASQQRADADLTEARRRLHREETARRRTRRLAVGLAAVLVVALAATGLAVVAQRSAEESSLAAERSALDADANRLAALSTTIGPLDLSSLLAAQAFRLADTPESRDRLLDGLVAHRRAVRATVFTGNLFGASLGDAGRTLVIYAGLAILRWDLSSGQSPQVLLDLAPVLGAGATVAGSREEWGTWRGVGVSPTDDRMVTSGTTTAGRPWIRIFDGGGQEHRLPSAATGGGEPFQVAFTRDGRLLDVFVSARGADVAGGSWRLLRVDPSGGGPETVATGTLPAGGPFDADVSADRSAAVVWSQDDTSQAVVVDLGRGSVARMSRPVRDAPPVGYRALSSGGAVLREDGAVTLVDRTGAVVQEVLPPGPEVADVALAPDGTWGVTVGAAGVVLWDVDRSTGLWSERETLVGHAGDPLSAEIDPSGERLVTVSADNTIIVWDVRPDGGFGTPQPGLAGRWPAGAPAVVEPGRSAVVPTRAMPDAGKDRHEDDTLGVAATFIDLRSGEVLEHVPVGDTVPDALLGASASVSPDGRWIAVTSGLDTTVLDARTRDVAEHIPLPANGVEGLDGQPYPAGIVCCAVWAPDGSRLLLGTGGHLPGALSNGAQPSGGIAVVDTRTWRVVEQEPLETSPATMQLDDGGRRLAVGSSNSSEILVLDPATLAEVERVPLRVDDSMWALAFSPDGRWLAGAGEQGKVHVIDTETWQAREAVAVRAFGPTLQLGWLPDDRTLVSTSDDGTAALFDVERAVVRTDPLPASTDGGPGYAALLPGAPEELSLVADDREGLRYPMTPSVWLRAACDVAGRDLTRAEWGRYLPGREYRPTCSDLG